MATLCPSCGTRNMEGTDECSNCGADLRSVDLPKPTSRIEQGLMQLPLTTLQFTHVHAISPTTPLEAALHTLNRQKLDILEVVEDGKLVGLLSVRDLITRVGLQYQSKLSDPVRKFMTPAPESLPPDAPINFAINKMDVGGYRHVPVVQDGKMVGLVSVRDVIRYIVKHSRARVTVTNKTTSHGAADQPAASA